jgi:hypothetical protein
LKKEEIEDWGRVRLKMRDRIRGGRKMERERREGYRMKGKILVPDPEFKGRKQKKEEQERITLSKQETLFPSP